MIKAIKKLLRRDYRVEYHSDIDRYTVYNLDGSVVAYREPVCPVLYAGEDYKVLMKELTAEQLELFKRHYRRVVRYAGKTAEYIPQINKTQWVLFTKHMFFDNEHEFRTYIDKRIDHVTS